MHTTACSKLSTKLAFAQCLARNNGRLGICTEKTRPVCLQQWMGQELPSHVRIVEVGPRDGLQNEKEQVGTPALATWPCKQTRTPFAPALLAACCSRCTSS